ncbi:MAG TPA: DUF4199 domain-containing protein, partial [Mucilaginibacter sp.]|nr:DUF4199 domain-containing protein [Mucilaginibacter sp.]
MKRNIIVCGLIAGLIVTSWFLVAMSGIFTIPYYGSLLLGYTSMLVAFSLIFVAVKNYRDKHSEGAISFGKAFRIGLWITLIASTIYVLVWMVDYYFFIPDYLEKYSAHEIAKLKAAGATQAQINAKIA